MPCPPPGDLPDLGIKPGIEPVSLTSPALVDRCFVSSTTWEALCIMLADIKSNDDYCHYCWDLYSIYCLPDAILTCLCLTKRGKKSHYEEGAPSTLTV